MGRLIFYSTYDKKFTEGFDTIANIYKQIDPNYIYLLLKTEKTLMVHDKKGNRTELCVLPF